MVLGLLDIIFVKNVSAFRTELRGVFGIFRSPSAFVTAVEGSVGGLFLAAFRTEFPLVHCTAGAGPSLGGSWLGSAAFHAEFSGIFLAAGTGPGVLCRRI